MHFNWRARCLADFLFRMPVVEGRASVHESECLSSSWPRSLLVCGSKGVDILWHDVDIGDGRFSPEGETIRPSGAGRWTMDDEHRRFVSVARVIIRCGGCGLRCGAVLLSSEKRI